MLRTKALKVLGQTLDVRVPDEDDADYARILSIKKDAAINVVSASLKADENCFRRRGGDVLEKLFITMQAEMERRNTAALTVDNMIPQNQP